MPTYIDTTNLSPATIAQLQGPIITQIQITNSSYVVLDDTAVSTSGGYIKITGSNFTAGTQVVIGTVAATSVTFVNSTTLNVQVPAQSAGSYVVYVTVNTGSVAILVNGLTYSGVPTWVTGSTLPAGQAGTAISIQLSATGDAPLTYALAAGSSLPSGVTLTSGGLLSGTVTGITNETVYNFTINAIDNELQDSPRGFSITITASDQYFEYITSLLSASTPTSTFVTDASTNSFAVTVNGDTRPSNFGPYTPGYYSNFFGTAQFKLSTTGMTALGSDFTLEVWIYPTSFNDYNTIFDNRTSDGDASGLVLGLTSAAKVYFYTNAAFQITTATSISLNTWTHIALVRSGAGSGNVKIYINGVADANTATYTTSFTRTAPSIGDDWSTRSNLQYYGYLSNLRATTSALYTGSFTPSTTPLTAISGTVLLTCQSNRFIDNSASNLAITRTGDVSVNGFDPFVPSSSFAGRGAGYFDGTGDYLTLPASQTALQPGSGDFTIELWYYYAASPGGYINMFSYGASGNVLRLFLYTTNSLIVWTGVTPIITANNAHVPSAWNHVAIVRSGVTVTLYVNGTSVGTATGGSTTNYVGDLSIAFESGQTAFTGYMSNFRMVKGTALYTTNFTPPATPLTAVANTQLLTLQNNQPNNNSMFLDSSTNNFNVTRNGNTTQGTFSPYGGGWSTLFSSGNYLSAASNAAFGFGTGDFTVEAWVFPNAAYTTYNYIWASGATGGLVFYVLGGVLYVRTYNGSDLLASSTAPALNTWTHVAATRSGTTLRIFVNGVQTASATNSTNFATGSALIGNDGSNVAPWLGYISNLRVVKGTALYTSNFTPSTTPLTPVAGTSLLACADNRFIDDSANGFAITVTGTPTIQRFNPFNPVTTTPTSYSGYFDGTGDYLTTPASSDLDVGNVSWTIECWVYMNTTSGTQMILGYNNLSASDFWDLTVVSGVPTFKRRIGGSEASVSGGTISANTFTHVAVVRNGTAVTIYLNGSSVATNANFSMPTSMTDRILGIGANRYGSGFDYYFNGYISNIRIVKGTAVYTSNFTPSTTPLTAIANTALLTLQSPTFIDNSTNNFTITNNGDTVPRQFNPFGWTTTTGSSAAYTPALYGGSAYFDGTGDYLLGPSGNSAFAMGTGDFTLECWLYLNAKAAGTHFFSVGNGSGTTWLLGLNNTPNFEFYAAGASRITGTTNPILSAWYHVAISRVSGSTRLFVNGVQEGSTYSDTNNYTCSAGFPIIGIRPELATPMNGYMSDLRVIKGQARYTSNFQPPVAPLTALQNTVLLNNMTGAGIYDSSMMNDFETVGNTSINTSIKKYGNTSMYFDGTGDYLISPASQNFVFGTGDFTIECWLYLTATGLDDGVIIELRSSGATGNGFVFNTRASGGGYVLNFYTDSAPNLGSTVLSLNTWNHVAVTRSGSTVRLFSNGAVSATITKSNNFSNSPNPTIGQSLLYSNSNITGYMDDLRITKGVARYTGTFTPPASPFINF